MDIYELLTTDIESLTDEDLVMFIDELAIGAYDEKYRSKCQLLIESEKHKRKAQKTRARELEKAVSQSAQRHEENKKLLDVALPTNVSPSVLVDPAKLSPFNKVEIPTKSPFEIVSSDVAAIRRSEKRKSLFKEYLGAQDLLDEKMLDAHLSFFDDWEMSAILSSMQLSEEFLEKYFGALDADRIARTQQFSEEFFMKHFSEFDAQLVLQKGKNSWRKKENRSRKLDTFLRLKGVQI